MPKKLTIKQQKAAKKFLECGNMTEAYEYAYDCSRCTRKSIGQRGWELMHLPHVAAYVKKLRDQAMSKSCLSRREALEILASIARGKLAAYLKKNGDINALKLVESGADLEEVAVAHTKYGINRKIKARNPIQAIERIAKLCGWDKQGTLELDGISINLNLGSVGKKGKD